jgi:hypothetical protein
VARVVAQRRQVGLGHAADSLGWTPTHRKSWVPRGEACARGTIAGVGDLDEGATPAACARSIAASRSLSKRLSARWQCVSIMRERHSGRTRAARAASRGQAWASVLASMRGNRLFTSPSSRPRVAGTEARVARRAPRPLALQLRACPQLLALARDRGPRPDRDQRSVSSSARARSRAPLRGAGPWPRPTASRAR